MTSPVWAFQQALYARLTADLGAVPVFDHAPQNQPAPFVDIGDIDTRQDDLLAGAAARRTAVSLVLSAWPETASRGQRALHELAETITIAVHERQRDMPLTAGSLVFVRVTGTRIVTESDGIARSVLVMISAYLQH